MRESSFYIHVNIRFCMIKDMKQNNWKHIVSNFNFTILDFVSKNQICNLHEIYVTYVCNQTCNLYMMDQRDLTITAWERDVHVHDKIGLSIMVKKFPKVHLEENLRHDGVKFTAIQKLQRKPNHLMLLERETALSS